MNELDVCLRYLARAQAAVADEEIAYVARSRLGRLILAVSQVVAKICGVSAVNRPEPLLVPPNAPVSIQTLIGHCNRVLELTNLLTRPSEPLDTRWRDGRTELVDELRAMETHLQGIRRRVSVPSN